MDKSSFIFLSVMVFINLAVNLFMFIRQRSLLQFQIYLYAMMEDIYGALFKIEDQDGEE